VQIFEGELRFGIHSGQQYSDFPAYLELWRAAERLGMDWASVFDHFLPIQADPEGPCFEGMTLLSAMAAHTERLRCGIIVLGVTYRHPAVLAKMAATIDHVANGRLELGIGAAWYELEHEQYGIPFPRIGVRMDMLEDACHIMRGMWTDRRTSYAGKHWTVTDALAEPKPVQERLPLWIGGAGERRTLRIVAEHADGWNTFLMPREEYQHKLDVLARHCADVGRDPADIRKQVVMRAVLGETEAEAEERLGELAATLGGTVEEIRDSVITATPEQLVEQLETPLAQGVGDFLLMSRPPGDLRTMELFATQVAPALRELAAA
jgi:F420-dependent oxidoreductase-like protein